MPQVLRPRASGPPLSIDAKIMAERSIKAGYMKDALKYLEAAHESDPGDFEVMRKLAWTNNILHRDALAFRWFDLARRSPDPTIAADAELGFHNLQTAAQRFRTTAWIFPVFSTRWHDVFAYGQVKEEVNIGLPLRPYASLRVVGDTRGAVGGGVNPQYLSESSFILALGVASQPWHGVTAWAEAGTAVNYLKGHMVPDYRGGISAARALHREGSPWLAEANLDALYMSRFSSDFLLYAQSRAGYNFGPLQLHWNGNVTVDARHQDWANFVETGPGLRIPMAQSMYLAFNLLRGAYLIPSPAHRATFTDFRAGFWYAITK